MFPRQRRGDLEVHQFDRPVGIINEDVLRSDVLVDRLVIVDSINGCGQLYDDVHDPIQWPCRCTIGVEIIGQCSPGRLADDGGISVVMKNKVGRRQNAFDVIKLLQDPVFAFQPLDVAYVWIGGGQCFDDCRPSAGTIAGAEQGTGVVGLDLSFDLVSCDCEVQTSTSFQWRTV
ncbi:MAG: hypothetical protein AAFY74_08330 [Pseudomonadota bacterium]